MYVFIKKIIQNKNELNNRKIVANLISSIHYLFIFGKKFTQAELTNLRFG